MPDNFFTGVLYGPQGPDNKRYGEYSTFGPMLDAAFDGHDGDDYLKKTHVLAKHGFCAATMFTIVDVMMYHPKGGIAVMLQRLLYHNTPWVGGAIAYTSVVNACCSFRGGKSDQLNHAIAGYAAGAVVGKHSRSFLTGLVTGSIFAVFGAVYKDCKMRGFTVVPEIHKTGPFRHGNPFTHKADFTTSWFKEHPAYWARTEADVPRIYKQGQLGDGDHNRKLW